jgi:hypothetical protein
MSGQSFGRYSRQRNRSYTTSANPVQLALKANEWRRAFDASVVGHIFDTQRIVVIDGFLVGYSLDPIGEIIVATHGMSVILARLYRYVTKQKERLGPIPMKVLLPAQLQRGKDYWIVCDPADVSMLVMWVATQTTFLSNEFANYVGTQVPRTRATLSRFVTLFSTTVHIEGEGTRYYPSLYWETYLNDRVVLHRAEMEVRGALANNVVQEADVLVTALHGPWAHNLTGGNVTDWQNLAGRVREGQA